MDIKLCNTDQRRVNHKRGLCWKINIIWSHTMRVFWSAYELFSKHSCIYIYIYIYIYIPVFAEKLWIYIYSQSLAELRIHKLYPLHPKNGVLSIFLPKPSHKLGVTRGHVFKQGLVWFELRVFLLLDWLP